MQPEDIAALSARAVSQLTAAQLDKMAATNLTGLNPKLMSSLSKDALLNCTDATLAAFDDKQIAGLDASKLTIIVRRNQTGYVGSHTPNTINSPLSISQIKAIPPKTLAQLGLSDLAKLSRTAVYNDYAEPDNYNYGTFGFTKEQIAVLSTAQLRGVSLSESNLAELTKAQVGKLDDSLTTSQMNSTVYRFIGTGDTVTTSAGAYGVPMSGSMQVVSNSINLLTPDAISGLTRAHISGLKEEQVKALSDSQIKAMTPSQLSQMQFTPWLFGPTDSLAAMFTTAQLGVMSAAQRQALGR
jgi:hypothetical protein